MKMTEAIEIRECTTVAEFDKCIKLQNEVFGLPDLESTPRRHFIVSRQAGGWTLGAFDQRTLVGFVHQMAGVKGNEIFGYSHMMAVAFEYQNQGIGARLKFAQRARALAEGRDFIKWTWDPLRARNAHFNLNRLGVIVEEYAENFYGTDYVTDPALAGQDTPGLDSDRLFASWYLRSQRVVELAEGSLPAPLGSPVATVAIPPNWVALLKEDAANAAQEQLRVRAEFKQALAAGLVCAAFDRDASRYLFFETGPL
jgi:predicted GNAT superfamily acetyltransferase